jgi:hypothetical protein
MSLDQSVDLLTDAILQRDQPRTADLFFRMVKREGRSLSDALSVVTAAEAPFISVLLTRIRELLGHGFPA